MRWFNCNKDNRIRVTEVPIIVVDNDVRGLPYYQIKYKELGDSFYSIGFGSYNLENVIQWKKDSFIIIDRFNLLSIVYCFVKNKIKKLRGEV